MITAFLGIGSNMPGDVGSPTAQIERAYELLAMHPAIEIVEKSRIFVTPPWGGVEQQEFRNSVVAVRTSLDSLALLHHCQFAEAVAGREREVRWGPRTVDVDILFCFDAQFQPLQSQGKWGFELVIPHPYAHERAFVLVPLSDLQLVREPWCTLGGRGILEWLEDVDPAEREAIVPADRSELSDPGEG